MMKSIEKNATARALKKSAVARYIQLAGMFRQRIESGEWAVGDKIPTVEMLAKQCGVAPMTIRQSMDILENEGLIERFRAKGTFIIDRPSQDLWCKVTTDWSGLLIARDDATIQIMSDERSVPLPKQFDLPGKVAPAYRHLRRKHSRNGAAFLLADVYVDERLCPNIPEEAYSQMTAMRLVADVPNQKIVDAHQIVTIGAADLEVSVELNMGLGEPIAKVRRVAVNQDGALVLVANGIYRGDMMKIEVKLR